MTATERLEHARRLLAELKASYDQLSAESRKAVRDQFTYCAQVCVAEEEEFHV